MPYFMRGQANHIVVLIIVIRFLVGAGEQVWGQVTVFEDDFVSHQQGEAFTTQGVIGSSSWQVSRSGADWGARIYNNQLELTNTASATANSNGWVFAYTETSSFNSPFETTLSNNTGLLSWTFNMRQIRTDPAGFGSGSYGVAYVLAGSSNTPATAGQGYAVVLGQSGSTDPIRLTRFSGGLQGSLTNIITSNTPELDDFGAEYLSIRVTYDPSNHEWELFLHNDGTTSFSDPSLGELTTQGIAIDNSHTNLSLPYSGAYWQGSTGTNQTAFFDNISVSLGPNMSVLPATLHGFAYQAGLGPSLAQSFTLSGDFLTGLVTINSPTYYEISTSSVSGYGSSLEITPADGSISSIPIFVRLISGLPIGSYDQALQLTSPGATHKQVVLTGSVTACGVSESFEGLPQDNPNQYLQRHWIGDDGFTWTTEGARTDQTIDGPAITWGTSGTRHLVSPLREGGVGTLSFSYVRAFTGTGSRRLEVYVNDNLLETIQVSNSSDEVQQFSREVQLSGPVQIEIRSTGAGQVKLDNLSWDCFFAEDCQTPLLQASNLVFNNLLPASVNLSWVKGDGSHSLVLVREGAAVSSDPLPNTSYLAESVFGDGDPLTDGSFVVYAATGNQVTMTGLAGGTTYHATVIPYNCINGNEKYLVGGSPAQISFTTPPATLSNLRITCTTDNTATITWESPSGNWDGVVIGVRQGSNPPHTLSIDPSTISYQESHTQFGTGYSYGVGHPPLSYVVYKGHGNEVTVTFPVPNPPYIVKAYVYRGTTWSPATPTRSVFTLGVPEVSALGATGLNTQVQLAWTNPSAGCFDEVMVVAHTQPIDGIPEGIYISSSRDYSHMENPDFPGGGKVVYNGLYGLQTITGLENDIPYYFKAFVRKGTDWSAGVESVAIPANVTVLDYADMAVLGVNTDTGSGDDEINVVLFTDFVAGSTLDFTDNGYERLLDGYWGTTEGVVRLTRLNTTLPAGTVITIRGKGSGFTLFAYDEPDPNWEITNLNSGIEGGSFNLSGADQVWFMQGGSWSRAEGLHRGIYTGKVLYGWTASGWESNAGYNSPSGSTLYPGTDCSHTDVSALGNNSKVKYTGPTSAAGRGDWIRRMNNAAYWTGYSTNAEFYDGGSFGYEISVNVSGMDNGRWLGAKDDNWFDCANWANLHVPGPLTDVVFDNDAQGNALISGGEAIMQSLSFNNYNGSFTIDGAETNIRILGDLVVDAGALFTQHNGILSLGGDLENNGAMILVGGTLILDGSTPQQIDQPEGSLNVNHLVVNNPHGVGVANNDLLVNGELTLLEGFLHTEQTIYLKNASQGALVAEEGTFILGTLRRDVTTGGTYPFPLSDGTQRQLAIVQLIEAPGLGSLSASFHHLSPDHLDISALGLEVDGTPLDELLDGGYWTITPELAVTADYHITLQLAGSGNPGSDPRQHTIVKRDAAAFDWYLDGFHTNTTQEQSGNVFTAVRSNLSGFSDFAIAKSDFGPLPIELLHFTAHADGDGVWLSWATAAEINNDYFTLQRSADMVSIDETGRVAGAGNSATVLHYTFFDPEPLQGIVYYRLKQTDLDGSSTFSKWVSINNGSKGEPGLRIVRIKQNQHLVTLLLEVIAGRAVTIGAYDGFGREHHRLETRTAHTLLEHTFPLPAPGLWIIRVSDGHHSLSVKLLLPR